MTCYNCYFSCSNNSRQGIVALRSDISDSISLPASIFPNKLAQHYGLFRFFTSFSTAIITPFINNLTSLNFFIYKYSCCHARLLHFLIFYFLKSCISTFFIKGKPTVINVLRKLRNPPRLIIFLVVPFNKFFLS